MKRFSIVVLVVGLVAGLGMWAESVSTVSSHYMPGLVDEINTALANPSTTTMTVSGNATVGGTFKATGAVTLGSTLRVTNVVTTLADVDNDATGGSTSDPDFSVDGYFKTFGISEHDGVTLFDGAVTNYAAFQTKQVTYIGDGGDAVAIDSSDWDINTTGDMTGIGSIAANGTIATTGAFTLNGEAAIYSHNGTALMEQSTNVAMHSGTVWTQTWTTAFSAAPDIVIVTPTELHAAVPFVSDITTNSVKVTVEASKNFRLVCIGAKP